jgi:uncharacterized protein (TIGR02246 family)
MTTVDSSTVAKDDARTIPQRLIEAWATNDAGTFAELFTDDATLILPNDVYLSSREQVRAYMASGFGGPMKGSRVVGSPLGLRYLGDDAAILVTQGGVVYAGEEGVAPENEIRATWVLAKRDGDWFIAAYHNTRVR